MLSTIWNSTISTISTSVKVAKSVANSLWNITDNGGGRGRISPNSLHNVLKHKLKFNNETELGNEECPFDKNKTLNKINTNQGGFIISYTANDLSNTSDDIITAQTRNLTKTLETIKKEISESENHTVFVPI